MAESAEVRGSVRRAIARIREFGIDGPRPIEEIEALMAHGDAVVGALQAALEAAAPADAAAAIHLVRLLRRHEVAPAVRRLAFETPVPLTAKREALETLEELEAEAPAQARQRLESLQAELREATPQRLAAVVELPAVWKIPAVRHWLAGADDEELPLIDELLGRDREVDPLLLEWLGGRGTAVAAGALRQYLATDPPRSLAKEARRALHRLRSDGVPVEETEPAIDGGGGGGFSLAIEPDVWNESQAWLSGYDGGGLRLVWLLVPSESGGNRLLEAVVDDAGGLRRIRLLAVSRRDVRDYFERLRSDADLLIGRAEPRRAAALLAEAEQRSREAGDELPEAWTRWRSGPAGRLMDEVADGERPAPRIYAEISEDEVRDRPDLVGEAVELLEDPAFGSWVVLGEPIERAAADLRNVETSRVLVDDDQRRRQADAVLTRALEAVDVAARQRYRRRLESMAWLLWDAGRRDEARRALAAAVAFTDVADLQSGHPFAEALVRRGVVVEYERLRQGRSDEAEQSPILRP